MEICCSLQSMANKIGPHGSLILVQIITASYVVLSKVIMVQGISSTVFLVYQFILATLFMGFLALIFERKKMPPLTKQILGGIFLLALIGVTIAQIMLATALYFISSTFESSVLNMIPAITFVLSLITRQEKLQLHTLWGIGKIFGTLLSISGALVLMFWRGGSLTEAAKSSSPNNFISIGMGMSVSTTTVGLVMVVIGVLAFSTWILMLEPMTRRYPAELSMTTIMFLFATLQTGIVAIILNREASQWQLKWDLELLNIVVGGALNSGLANFFVAWCAGLKGPVFVASFAPLGLLFTTILETIFLGQTMGTGSIFGSVMIIVGLYIYLLSKAQEEKYQILIEAGDLDDQMTSSLLQNNQIQQC
ncbi:WAT1-related protein At4g01440-like [Papaver somniferum]|uniref:WAT1-related protein At4g01440-like n=1 Tax=Papaver somniferum TaxID=3469 RepID=UPI000E6F726E|nr:WAT1-related protein At4g01440-like [Papaver somniferum]